ncbi:MAG TPA: NUDIX domain-containing protein [Gammaproteobacteria bacterium]|nr:NUDIX domain-containing protein [Gammaproteobacteria bacterium]
MSQHSAGILLYRFRDGRLELLLGHPGGPFFARKDEGVWSIPKGLREDGEDLLQTARREFGEETGFAVDGQFLELGSARMRSGKTVHVWALEKDVDADRAVSNHFEMEWPRGSGRVRSYPEMDRAAWFPLTEARTRIFPGQRVFLDRLLAQIGYTEGDGAAN